MGLFWLDENRKPSFICHTHVHAISQSNVSVQGIDVVVRKHCTLWTKVYCFQENQWNYMQLPTICAKALRHDRIPRSHSMYSSPSGFRSPQTALCKGITLPLRTVNFPNHTINVWTSYGTLNNQLHLQLEPSIKTVCVKPTAHWTGGYWHLILTHLEGYWDGGLLGWHRSQKICVMASVQMHHK